MAVTVEFSPEREAVLQAEARGLTLEEWLIALTDERIPPASIAHLQRTNPDEWARLLDAFIDSHDPSLPVLSDEAMSRGSVYPYHA